MDPLEKPEEKCKQFSVQPGSPSTDPSTDGSTDSPSNPVPHGQGPQQVDFNIFLKQLSEQISKYKADNECLNKKLSDTELENQTLQNKVKDLQIQINTLQILEDNRNQSGLKSHSVLSRAKSAPDKKTNRSKEVHGDIFIFPETNKCSSKNQKVEEDKRSEADGAEEVEEKFETFAVKNAVPAVSQTYFKYMVDELTRTKKQLHTVLEKQVCFSFILNIKSIAQF